MIYMPVICRDKINKVPVRIYICYVLKYSASRHREIIKSLRMPSGMDILSIATPCLYHILLCCKYWCICSLMMVSGRRNMWG
jgi:hypothetical protein